MQTPPFSSILFAFAVAVVAPRMSAAQASSSFQVSLRPDLTLGEAKGISFGSALLHLAVDSHGKIFVGDWLNTEVRVFSAAGEPLETIGRRGKGPGEFGGIHQVVVSRGDSLYVFDASMYRLSVYGPDSPRHLAYTLTVSPPQGVGRPTRMFVPRDAQDGFLAAFSRSSDGVLEVRRVDGRGGVGDHVIVRARDSEPEVQRQQGGGAISVVKTAPLFGRKALLGMSPDGTLFSGWSGEIDLTFYDESGEWVGVFRSVSQPVPVRDADVAYELRGASKARRRALEDAPVPTTKPALETVVVDDKSRVWIDRYTADATVSEWSVTTRTQPTRTAVFTLPDRVKLQVIRGEYAYGVSEDEEGFPTVVRFRIVTSGATGSGLF